jgi:hypothetical protein
VRGPNMNMDPLKREDLSGWGARGSNPEPTD